MFRAGDNADASPDADVTYIDKLMGELGCNILRIMVQDDYLNYIDNKIQSRNSDVFYHNARDNFFPVIRRVNDYGGYVFANAWTAPASMKVGGSVIGLDGGKLKPDSYIAYANHFRDFLKWLNDNDAPIFCVGILNEPDWGGKAPYEGMDMVGDEARDWFRLVGHFTTQRITNPNSATPGTQTFVEDIIPGYGGGGPTHHVLVMSGDSMGDLEDFMKPQIEDINGPAGTTGQGANNRIEVMGRHYYSGNGNRYEAVVGGRASAPFAWTDRPQLGYVGPYEAESLAVSPQMYAPGSTPGNIKREVWQTEHDFNHGSSTVPDNVVTYWNAAFAAMNEIDHTLRIVGESVHDWWFSSSFSGYVTSNHRVGWPEPYTITPRGRAIAHYARYVNETWLLGSTQTNNERNITFNVVDTRPGNVLPYGALDAASMVPKFSAFEDQNGRFISVVMFAPNEPTANVISGSFGGGGSNGVDDPAKGSVNVGRVGVILPEGFTVTNVSAIRSWGKNAGQYWQPEPVFMSEDGKTGEVTLPGGNIISIRFEGYWSAARSGYPAGY
jgi:O-glycosyl hydrolase